MSATWEGTSGSHLSSLSCHQAVAEEDMVSPSRSSNPYDPWYVKTPFIEPDDGSKDVFVHITSVADPSVDNFAEDRRVSFNERISKRSGQPEAFDVVVL